MEPLRVQAFRSGTFTINGEAATMADLRTALQRVRDAGGIVWFYREGASGEPTDHQFQIFRAIADAKVRISLSTKPDFSDYFNFKDGQPYRRR